MYGYREHPSARQPKLYLEPVAGMKIDYSPLESNTGSRPVHRIVAITALCVVGAAMLLSRETVAKRQAPMPVELATAKVSTAAIPGSNTYEQAMQAAVSTDVPVPAASDWSTVTVEKGDSLSTLFSREDLPADDWMSILKLGGDALELKRLNVGEQVLIRKDGDELAELKYPIDELRTLHIMRDDNDKLTAETLTASIEHKSVETGGVIENSLFLDGHKAGMSDRMIMEMADLFGYDVDFALDLRKGDRFTVVYDQLYTGGEKLRNGDILAAEFVNQNHVYRAVRFVNADGESAYYTPAGQSLKKAFLRTPVAFTRISSPFNLARRHPILNTIRAHKGVDYAAPSGTPIKAVGDGKVAFIGVKGGYGNVIVLQHGPQYSTLYGHMSRFRPGLKAGSRVEQGQVIGYVGMTGLATGPHLHFEFHINGQYVNPVTVPLPRANPIDPSLLAQFKSQSAPLVAELETYSQKQLAQIEGVVPATVTTDSTASDASAPANSATH